MLDAVKMLEANATYKFITYRSRILLSIKILRTKIEQELKREHGVE